MFAGNFAPAGWATCDGQLMPISQNISLFSLLGTMYGGDGTSTFALPNLQGSTPLQQGQGLALASTSREKAAASRPLSFCKPRY
jgi:microcystin-dependent protein